MVTEEEKKAQLAQLAQQAYEDPNNPHVGAAIGGPVGSYVGGTPQTTDPNAPFYVNPNSPYAPPSSKPYISPMDARKIDAQKPFSYAPETMNPNASVSGPTQESKDANMGYGPSNPNAPTRENPTGKAPALTTVPGAQLAAGSGISRASSVSPDQMMLNAEDKATKGKIELANSGAGVVQAQQGLMQTGEDAAKAAMAQGESDRVKATANIAQANQMAQIRADQRSKQLDQQAGEVRAMKVDPNHWFKEAGTAGSILAALSIGAGAFAAAMPGTTNHENAALTIIGKAIDRDVAAQESNINSAWKGLNFQGDQDEKDYVRGEHKINAMQEAKATDYNHAIALATNIRNSTNNQVAIKGLDNTILGLKGQVVDLQKDQELRMATVLQKQLSASAAAAAYARGLPTSKESLERRFAAIHDKWMEMDPDKRGDEPNKTAFFQSAQGVDANGKPLPVGSNSRVSKEESAVKNFEEQGVKASNASPADDILSHIPFSKYFAPEATKNIQDLKVFNETTLPAGMRSAGDREENASVMRKIAPFQISPYDTTAQKKQKAAGFAELIRNTQAEKGKNTAPATTTGVPGATLAGD